MSGNSVFLLCIRLAEEQREGLDLSDGKKLVLTSLVLRSFEFFSEAKKNKGETEAWLNLRM